LKRGVFIGSGRGYLEKVKKTNQELDQKIKDELNHAEKLREKRLEEVRQKASAEVSHAKEVAAKVKSEKKEKQ